MNVNATLWDISILSNVNCKLNSATYWKTWQCHVTAKTKMTVITSVHVYIDTEIKYTAEVKYIGGIFDWGKRESLQISSGCFGNL